MQWELQPIPKNNILVPSENQMHQKNHHMHVYFGMSNILPQVPRAMLPYSSKANGSPKLITSMQGIRTL